jgi:hypothetical protein
MPQLFILKLYLADDFEADAKIQALESEIDRLKTLLRDVTERLIKLETAEPASCPTCDSSLELPPSETAAPSPGFKTLPKSFGVSTLSAWQRKPLESTPARQHTDASRQTASIFKKTNPFSYTPARAASPAKTAMGRPTPAASMRTLYGTEQRGHEIRRSSSVSGWGAWQ